MDRLRRWLLLGIVTALLFVAAGCGVGEETTETSRPTSNSPYLRGLVGEESEAEGDLQQSEYEREEAERESEDAEYEREEAEREAEYEREKAERAAQEAEFEREEAESEAVEAEEEREAVESEGEYGY